MAKGQRWYGKVRGARCRTKWGMLLEMLLRGEVVPLPDHDHMDPKVDRPVSGPKSGARVGHDSAPTCALRTRVRASSGATDRLRTLSIGLLRRIVAAGTVARSTPSR